MVRILPPPQLKLMLSFRSTCVSLHLYASCFPGYFRARLNHASTTLCHVVCDLTIGPKRFPVTLNRLCTVVHDEETSFAFSDLSVLVRNFYFQTSLSAHACPRKIPTPKFVRCLASCLAGPKPEDHPAKHAMRSDLRTGP